MATTKREKVFYKYFDETYNHYYYQNKETGDTQWEMPE